MNKAESKTLMKLKMALIAIILTIVFSLLFLSGKENHVKASFSDKAQRELILLTKKYSISELNLNNETYIKSLSTKKISYVNFWALWCEPCIEELPMLLKLKNKLGNINMIFVNIDPEEKKEKATEFWNSLKSDTATLYTDNNLVFSYTIGVPYHQVFNKDKELISHFFGEIIGREKEFSIFLNKLTQM